METAIFVILVGVVVRLGMIADWSVTATETGIALGCLAVALLTVGAWHRLTHRRRD